MKFDTLVFLLATSGSSFDFQRRANNAAEQMRTAKVLWANLEGILAMFLKPIRGVEEPLQIQIPPTFTENWFPQIPKKAETIARFTLLCH